MKIAGRQFSRNSGQCLKYVHQIYAKNLIKCCITVYIIIIMYILITDTTSTEHYVIRNPCITDLLCIRNPCNDY